jgi:hypothetical protein
MTPVDYKQFSLCILGYVWLHRAALWLVASGGMSGWRSRKVVCEVRGLVSCGR